MNDDTFPYSSEHLTESEKARERELYARFNPNGPDKDGMVTKVIGWVRIDRRFLEEADFDSPDA